MKLGAKVKEKIARTIAGYFTTNQIVSVFEDANISTDISLYAKWRITLDAFGKIPKPEEGLFPVLEEFCHPLCFPDLATREKFIKDLNDTLSYENLVIKFTEKTAKIVSLNDKSVEDGNPSVTSKIELPEINNCTYSEKALELVASHLSNFISHSELRKMIIKVLGAKNALLNETSIKDYMDDFFEETPFYNFADVLQTIRKKDVDADKTISKLIASLLHPLNHNADEKMAGDLANQVANYLKYDNFTVEKIDKGYVVLSQKERNEREQYLDAVVEEMQQEAPDEGDEDEILRQCDIATLTEAKDKIRKIRDCHQAYIDIIEIFCRNTKKPTKELNDAYLLLGKKIQNGIKDLKLQYYSISLYKPFKEDLYKAEMEWNGDEIRGFVNLGPSLSWDTIRPHLYAVHSEITSLCYLAEEDADMTDDEKKLEEINNLISQQRAPKLVKPTPEKITKIEITGMPDLNVRNVEDTNIIKGKKKITLPKFSPTEWGKVHIRFIDENNVYITADKKTSTADFEGLGFCNDKNGKPNTAWKFLLELAKNNGETPVIQSPIPDTIKNQKRVLSDRLKTIFKNDTDPFYDFTETNTYKCKIKLTPPITEEKGDTLGVSEYLNETMTSEYESL